MNCNEIISVLEKLSPTSYAEEWDNVGLLVGRYEKEVSRVMLALDATDEVVDLAVKNKVDMLITHHPMIFSAMKKINDSDMIGRRVLKLAANDISYYAMHTNFDIMGGMAELAADVLGLRDRQVLEVTMSANKDSSGSEQGFGRTGYLDGDYTTRDIGMLVKENFGLDNVMLYGESDYKPCKIAIIPGSGKSMIRSALDKKCDLLITGDIGHHEGIDAVDMGLHIIDATHFGLEHVFMDFIKSELNKNLEGLDIIIKDMGCPMVII